MVKPNTDDPAKALLLSVGEARIETHRLQRKIAYLDAKARRVTSYLSHTPKGGGSGVDPKDALADVRAEYVRQLIEAEEHELQVAQFIDALPTQACRCVLKLRYLEGLKWSDVERRMRRDGYKCTERQVFRIHGQALNEARDAWEALQQKEETN